MSIAKTRLESTLADINRNIQEINLCQMYQYARLGILEKEIQAMQKVSVELPRAIAKAPAPIESEED